MKLAVEELEGRMQSSHEKGVEDENVINKAISAKTKKQPKLLGNLSTTS